jgi:hypothetical protein
VRPPLSIVDPTTQAYICLDPSGRSTAGSDSTAAAGLVQLTGQQSIGLVQQASQLPVQTQQQQQQQQQQLLW